MIDLYELTTIYDVRSGNDVVYTDWTRPSPVPAGCVVVPRRVPLGEAYEECGTEHADDEPGYENDLPGLDGYHPW